MSISSIPQSSGTAEEQEWLEVVRQKVAKLRFGSLQITVHDGRVAQIESVEKTRFLTKTRDGQ
ncbi:MAG: YezD family protein [Verrucomicrobiota bacterium]